MPTNEARFIELHSCIGWVHGQHLGKDHLHDEHVQRGSVPGVHTRQWWKYTHWAYLVGQRPFAQFLATYSVFPVTMHIRQVYLESH